MSCQVAEREIWFETYAEHEREEADDVRVEEEVVAVLTDERDGEEEDSVGAGKTDDTSENLGLNDIFGNGARDGPLVDCKHRLGQRLQHGDTEA